jgi:hypothetical protein
MNAVICSFSSPDGTNFNNFSIVQGYFDGKSQPSSYYDDQVMYSNGSIGYVDGNFSCEFSRLNTYSDPNYVTIDDSPSGYYIEVAYDTS